jgi:hypothetical protein
MRHVLHAEIDRKFANANIIEGVDICTTNENNKYNIHVQGLGV